MALVIGASVAAGDGAAARAGGRTGNMVPVAACHPFYQVKKTLPETLLRTRKRLHVAAAIAPAVTAPAATARSVLTCHAMPIMPACGACSGAHRTCMCPSVQVESCAVSATASL
jgi:hypothetical protein